MTAPFEGSATMARPNPATLSSIYDTYLCKDLLSRSPTPEIDLLDLPGSRLKTLQSSVGYFSKQGRTRTVERLKFETARLYLEEKEWKKAMKVLIPLWQTISWRQAGWWHLVEEINWALKRCAHNVGDAETLLAVEWELMNNSFTAKEGWHYDFSRCLEDLDSPEIRPKAVLQSEKIKSCLSASFAFCSRQGYVGESLSSQLILVSQAHDSSAPILLSQVKLEFSGGLKNVKILHDPKFEPALTTKEKLVHFYNVPLQQVYMGIDAYKNSASRSSEASHFVFGTSELTLAPGSTKILAFESVPREPGNVEAASVTIYVNADNFDFEIVVTDVDQLNIEDIWIENMGSLLRKQLFRGNNTIVNILPKPPKIRIEISNIKKLYLTDELINFAVEVFNEEESSADVILEAQFLESSARLPDLRWTSEEGMSQSLEPGPKIKAIDSSTTNKSTISLGVLPPNDTWKHKLSFQSEPEAAEYNMQIKAIYHLLPDPDTPIFKIFETMLTFIRPFEANYSLSPRVHQAPWPNYFSVDDDSDFDQAPKINIIPRGLCQKWLLTARIASFAIESIVIEDVRLQLLEDLDDIVCKISQSKGYINNTTPIMPKSSHTRQFDLEVQKYNLEDRQNTILNLQLEIQWRCEDSNATSAITHIIVPELDIPFGEPRVLAIAEKEQGKGDLIFLDYIIENPSKFLLPFDLTMDTAEDFAFSGPKATSLQLVPLSRHTIRYHILPLTQGIWISPNFRVVDVHFNKTLKVHATEGIRSDSKGLYVWIDGGSGK